MKLTKKIEISFDFQYLDEDDFKNIEEQLSKFNDKEGFFDITELCTSDDYDASFDQPYIEDNNIKIDINVPYELPSGDWKDNIITFPIKKEYWDMRHEVMNEVIAYLMYLIFLQTDIINWYITPGNKEFEIKKIDKITSNQ